MVAVQLLLVFCVIMNCTLARPDSPANVEASSDIKNETSSQIPSKGIVYGLIFNFKSPDGIRSIETKATGAETVTSKNDTSSTSGEKLVRKKRFLFNIIGAALESLRSDNWRECGRTPWGTRIYTNGIATACIGACPEHGSYCGYGNNGYGYGYGGTQINTVYFG